MIPIAGQILVAAAIVAAAYGAGRVHGGEKIQDRWDKAKAVQVSAALEAEQAVRQVEAQRRKLSQDIEDDARKKVARAKADAASAAAAADGLRSAARAAADRAGACDPAAAGSRAADSLAEVLTDLDRAGRAIAVEADAAVIAGRACERAYSTLKEAL